ncbi:NAD-dependent epimerase/dehydratase family protein [Cellulomonas xiejunii]|uniref:NAD(P)-dependent oxidoreductase n=1 Tax=Cellulomonas xiejunii TaxID=2968083 RepID=A0ABY5KJ71_9CELL|nr:NAD(P)-dependent oxidoreductase [Cellulomonas xiejunii]MCC2312910.1 NAD(P)-dependent oxidoreductase [Cellulomonas xiejunii]MCC2320220.1 NAD(P)-dependent oxidoreductase [Cellulomonas xiejunii]UUI70527.1 NAD(P)-dependent oxidoreductase [Cellulomonas xiejunii]
MSRLHGVVADALDADEHVAVTGATGWFGATALDLLFEVLGPDAPHRVTAYASRRREVTVADGRKVEVRPLAELPTQVPAPTTVLHFGYLTRDRVADLGVGPYVLANLTLTQVVLDAIARHRPRRVVMTSSGAVYRADRTLVTDVENDPYGALKHLDELAFRTACADVGATCVVPRVFSVAGPRMTKPEKYALGSMVLAAQAGSPVQVRATGPVVRSFCGVDEVIAVALFAAAQGKDLVFDTGGTTVEVGELAGVVAATVGRGPGDVERTWDPSAPADVYTGDQRRMDELAAGAGLELRDLPALVRATADWLAGRVPAGTS